MDNESRVFIKKKEEITHTKRTAITKQHVKERPKQFAN